MISKPKEPQGNLLIIDDEPEVLKALKRQFRKKYNVYLANSATEGYQIIREQDIQVVISDQRMPNMTGTAFVKKIKTEFPDAIRLILTAYADINSVISAVNDGNVFHYLLKPWAPAKLKAVVEDAFQQYWLIYGNQKLMTELTTANTILKQEIEERKRTEIAKDAAEAANQAKTVFLNTMSHELRTPLNAILGFSQLLSHSSNLEPEQQKKLESIRNSGEHLLNLINDVLDMAQIESGHTILYAKAFGLSYLLTEVEGMFRLKVEEKGLHLIFECAADLPHYIRADEGKLRQVLLNLLHNALKFTQEGTIWLRVKPLPVENKAGEKIKTIKLHFEVEDTGEGIPPAERDGLFDAFVQTESGRKSEQGTGLGLAISQKFVQLMGGDISVANAAHRGTVFSFWIQVEVSEGTEIKTAQLGKHIIAVAPGQPRYRILIADDKESNRLLLTTLLDMPGFELREAKNGQEAVEIWERWNPDLIFMDMRMPLMNGYEAIKIIKGKLTGQSTIIIAVTASVFEEERATVLSIGSNDLLFKPFKAAHIFEMMHRHLGVRYLYQEDTSDSVSERSAKDMRQKLTPERLGDLPPELLIELKEASVQGDMDKVESLIKVINAHDAAVADALALLVADFEYEKILQLIRI